MFEQVSAVRLEGRREDPDRPRASAGESPGPVQRDGLCRGQGTQ